MTLYIMVTKVFKTFQHNHRHAMGEYQGLCIVKYSTTLHFLETTLSSQKDMSATPQARTFAKRGMSKLIPDEQDHVTISRGVTTQPCLSR